MCEQGDGLGKILSSSKSYARSHFILEGLSLEIGSVEETLAFRAFQQRNLSEYYKVLSVVQAIMYGFSSMIKVMSQEQPGSPEALNDLLTQLRNLLLPETVKETEDKAKKVKQIMENEISSGPFKVESMVYKKKGKGLN